MIKENVQMLQKACNKLEGYEAILRAELEMNKISKENKKYYGVYNALGVIEDNIYLIRTILTKEFGEYIEDFDQYMNKPE